MVETREGAYSCRGRGIAYSCHAHIVTAQRSRRWECRQSRISPHVQTSERKDEKGLRRRWKGNEGGRGIDLHLSGARSLCSAHLCLACGRHCERSDSRSRAGGCSAKRSCRKTQQNCRDERTARTPEPVRPNLRTQSNGLGGILTLTSNPSLSATTTFFLLDELQKVFRESLSKKSEKRTVLIKMDFPTRVESFYSTKRFNSTFQIFKLVVLIQRPRANTTEF